MRGVAIQGGGRWGVAALAVGCSLLLPAGAGAAKAGTRSAKDAVKVIAHRWKVSVNGHVYAVPASGRLVYRSCETLEAITPVVTVMTARTGRHGYPIALRGPKAAGSSGMFERPFEGRRSTLEAPFTAAQFQQLAEETNSPSLVPGVYSLLVRAGGKNAKPVVIDSIRLAAKPGC